MSRRQFGKYYFDVKDARLVKAIKAGETTTITLMGGFSHNITGKEPGHLIYFKDMMLPIVLYGNDDIQFMDDYLEKGKVEAGPDRSWPIDEPMTVLDEPVSNQLKVAFSEIDYLNARLSDEKETIKAKSKRIDTLSIELGEAVALLEDREELIEELTEALEEKPNILDHTGVVDQLKLEIVKLDRENEGRKEAQRNSQKEIDTFKAIQKKYNSINIECGGTKVNLGDTLYHLTKV